MVAVMHRIDVIWGINNNNNDDDDDEDYLHANTDNDPDF